MVLVKMEYNSSARNVLRAVLYEMNQSTGRSCFGSFLPHIRKQGVDVVQLIAYFTVCFHGTQGLTIAFQFLRVILRHQSKRKDMRYQFMDLKYFTLTYSFH